MSPLTFFFPGHLSVYLGNSVYFSTDLLRYNLSWMCYILRFFFITLWLSLMVSQCVWAKCTHMPFWRHPNMCVFVFVCVCVYQSTREALFFMGFLCPCVSMSVSLSVRFCEWICVPEMCLFHAVQVSKHVSVCLSVPGLRCVCTWVHILYKYFCSESKVEQL